MRENRKGKKTHEGGGKSIYKNVSWGLTRGVLFRQERKIVLPGEALISLRGRSTDGKDRKELERPIDRSGRKTPRGICLKFLGARTENSRAERGQEFRKRRPY